MTIEEVWAKLDDNEKNKIITEKILELEDIICEVCITVGQCYVEYDSNAVCDFKYDFLNWTGFGMIVEKVRSISFNHNTERGYVDVTLYHDDTKGRQIVGNSFANTPWDAAALAYLKMKGIKI